MATDFGQRLKQARHSAKLTQVQLSKAAGLSQSTLADLEKNGYGSAKVATIAQACNVNPIWLATGEGHMRAGAAQALTPRPPTLQEALQTLALALSSVPAEKRQAVLGVLATYAANPGGEANALAYLQNELGKTQAPALSTETNHFAGKPPLPATSQDATTITPANPRKARI